MKVEILGYTNNPEKNYLPEAISAGFARVSRRQEPISFLVEEAKGDLDKARKSNTNIIYGYGHNSIAEHIVFNVVFEKVSRLLSLIIMKHRINSYIEKSQRYIEIDSGYVKPKEIQDSTFKEQYEKTCNDLFIAYANIIEKLKAHIKKKHPDWKPILIENTAKEDARFILPISTYTQFGMTLNARNYEYMLMRLSSQKLIEAQVVGERLQMQGKSIAPSVIKYTDSKTYFKESYNDIKDALGVNMATVNAGDNVRLVDYDEDGDEKLLAAIMHTVTNLSYSAIKSKIKDMNEDEKRNIIKKAICKLAVHDQVLREFEYVNFTFEIDMSECCYHQFIRHRMNTQTFQELNPSLGFVVPPLVKEVGLTDEFNAAVAKSTRLFNEMKNELGEAAQYVLTNAHKRRVLVRMNARTLYHFSRIREEEYAQWEIREIAMKMSKLAKEKTPLCLEFTGGRSDFKKVCGI